jgi:hypothetical protein
LWWRPRGPLSQPPEIRGLAASVDGTARRSLPHRGKGIGAAQRRKRERTWPRKEAAR